VSGVNSEVRQQESTEQQLAGESCSSGEADDNGRQQNLQEESDQPTCSQVGELDNYACTCPY
jgi:hypothetical protein